MSGLPEGWVHVPTKPETRCDSCGHTEPARPGTLRAPDGRSWPLIGNSGKGQERQMVKAIIDGHQLAADKKGRRERNG